MSKIKVLVVDDSPMVRKLITAILEADREIEVIGSAADPIIARRKIKQLNPDVLTLDVEMPNMDGITFLRNLMRLRPMPVVMVSTLTEKGADTTLRALELGAVGYVAKPKVDLVQALGEIETEIVREVKLAAKSKARCPAEAGLQDATSKEHLLPAPNQAVHALVAIGASTGGVEAIKEVLLHLPVQSPPIVITQHIAPDFSCRFAKRLDQQVAMTVHEARRGMPIEPGHVYIAPGSHHLEIRRSGDRMNCHLREGDKVSGHRPSVDVLFRSVAENVGPSAMGVLLTGMGEDGAAGLRKMQAAGCYTIAQDEATSVVWGMPGTAVKFEAAKDVLPLPKIAARLLSPLSSSSPKT